MTEQQTAAIDLLHLDVLGTHGPRSLLVRCTGRLFRLTPSGLLYRVREESSPTPKLGVPHERRTPSGAI